MKKDTAHPFLKHVALAQAGKGDQIEDPEARALAESVVTQVRDTDKDQRGFLSRLFGRKQKDVSAEGLDDFVMVDSATVSKPGDSIVVSDESVTLESVEPSLTYAAVSEACKAMGLTAVDLDAAMLAHDPKVEGFGAVLSALHVCAGNAKKPLANVARTRETPVVTSMKEKIEADDAAFEATRKTMGLE